MSGLSLASRLSRRPFAGAPFRWAILLVVLAGASACDDPFIDPYVNPGRYYTVWGFVDATKTEQTLRVIPVTRVATADRAPTTEDLDATVVTIDVSTGAETIWRSTIAELDDGSFAHVFRTNVRFRPGYLYRLEVRRSDGKKASAETWIPDYNAFQSVVRDSVRLDADGHYRQRITLRGIPSPWNLRFTYLAQSPVARLIHEVPHGRAGQRTPDGDWEIDLDLTADQPAVKEHVRNAILNGEIAGEGGLSTPFNLHQMGVRLTLTDSAWDLPDGELDPERFALPDAHTNIENGYGYWGSVNYFEEKWLVTYALSVALGWDY